MKVRVGGEPLIQAQGETQVDSRANGIQVKAFTRRLNQPENEKHDGRDHPNRERLFESGRPL